MTGRVCIIGVGGAGCRIIDHVVDVAGQNAAVIAINTDAGALSASHATTKLQIGESITDGLGAGGDPGVGRKAVEDDIGMIRTVVEDADIVFVVAGLGGGTGTGATPIILNIAREAGALTLCFVTLPFRFEGHQRTSVASDILGSLREFSDILVTTPNERLCKFVGEVRAAEAFEKADMVLGSGVSAIVRMITKPGFINLDFADLQNTLQHCGGVCTFGYGYGEGEDKAQDALVKLFDSPLLSSDELLAGAQSLLVSIVGGQDLTLVEISMIMDGISSRVKKDCHISMGTVKEELSEGKIAITVLVSDTCTSFDESGSEKKEKPLHNAYSRGVSGINNSWSAKKSSKVDNELELQLPLFQLDTVSKRRFKDIAPTIMNGEDLDIPTFIRRRLSI
ncbi:MAG: cell division FtsZ family protein [Kiritimatiellae bacterium]|nr:cell division FtsZ family protein [Kiritimatiellia bacterium]